MCLKKQRNVDGKRSLLPSLASPTGERRCAFDLHVRVTGLSLAFTAPTCCALGRAAGSQPPLPHQRIMIYIRLKYRNGGIWYGPRVVPVLREGIYLQNCPNTLFRPYNLDLHPARTRPTFVSKESGVFFLFETLTDHINNTKKSPISIPYPRYWQRGALRSTSALCSLGLHIPIFTPFLHALLLL